MKAIFYYYSCHLFQNVEHKTFQTPQEFKKHNEILPLQGH